jgi:sugar phosphate isomerase/epimerase
MGALRSRHNIPLAESIKEVRQQIENAAGLGLPFLLTFGVDKPEEYEHYYKVMGDAAAAAQERRIKLVMKPHGGGSGASAEIVAAMKAVKHPNFKLWYDAGNIIYYTGKDPVEELKTDRAACHGFLCQGLRRAQERRHDPVRHRQGRLRRGLRHAEGRRLRRTDHGRVLQDRRDRRRDDGQCARQSCFLETCLPMCKR